MPLQNGVRNCTVFVKTLTLTKYTYRLVREFFFFVHLCISEISDIFHPSLDNYFCRQFHRKRRNRLKPEFCLLASGGRKAFQDFLITSSEIVKKKSVVRLFEFHKIFLFCVMYNWKVCFCHADCHRQTPTQCNFERNSLNSTLLYKFRNIYIVL